MLFWISAGHTPKLSAQEMLGKMYASFGGSESKMDSDYFFAVD